MWFSRKDSSGAPSKAAAKEAAPIPADDGQAKASADDELARIIAGAPNDDARIADTKKFIGSNTRHTYVDGALGIAAYTFSGLQHVHGQSTALTLLSMWAAGTTFLVNAAMRKVLTEASLASIEAPDAASPTPPTTGENHSDTTTKTIHQKEQKNSKSVTVAQDIDSTGSTSPSQSSAAHRDVQAKNQLRSIASAADFDLQRRNVFQLDAVGSWIWMLASLQQFRIHKRLKWCGYSSWMGLGCAVYYTFRHMYNVLVM